MQLTRRRLLQGTASLGVVALVPGCAAGADGTYERPFTREDPGPWKDKVEVHQPVVFGALVDETRVRIWVEVQDVAAAKVHEMTAEHHVSRILVQDQDGNVLADAAYAPDTQARLIVTTEIPAGVTELYVYEECNLHGVWLAVYSVAEVKVPPIGDPKRPLTSAQPGEWGDKIAGHVPVLLPQADGSYLIEIGDRAADKLHVSEPEHYIDQVLVYDQNGQLLGSVTIGPDRQPSFAFTPPAGTTAVRVIAWCNLHDWWELEATL